LITIRRWPARTGRQKIRPQTDQFCGELAAPTIEPAAEQIGGTARHVSGHE
jgi:hypothetical protein